MKITGIASFGDAHVSIGFDVTPQQAVDYFRSKGLRESFNYDDLLAEEHAAAFTVAKMADIDLLRDVHESLQQALQDGMRFQDWADMLRPTLQAKGWWGRQAVRDPVTGATIVTELGSARRLETIFRTNMQSAYAVGQWQQIKDQQADAPYLMYDAVDDYRTRAQHAAWDNKVLPVSSQWWDTHMPPNGYNCFLPETPIRGDLKGAIRRQYFGVAVEVRTVGGQSLRLTANHPVLTRRGWVRADMLKRGDDLLRYREPVEIPHGRGSSGQVHHNQPMATAEQVFEAFVGEAFAFGQATPLKLDHNALRGCEVHIDSVNRRLTIEMQPQRLAGQPQSFFKRRHDIGFGHLPAVCTANPDLVPLDAVVSKDALDIAPGAAHDLGNHARTQFVFPIELQDPAFEVVITAPSGLPGSSALSGHTVGRLFDGLPLDTFRLAAATDEHTLFHELSANGVAADAGLFGHLLEAHARLVFVDPVLHIRHFNFCGHVYDFQSSEGVLCANGIIAHNCRCSVIQLDAQDVESMGLTVGRAPRAESHPWKNPRTGQVEQIPAGVDPQFAHNPGQTRHAQLQKIAKEKISQLPGELQEDAKRGLQSAKVEAPIHRSTFDLVARSAWDSFPNVLIAQSHASITGHPDYAAAKQGDAAAALSVVQSVVTPEFARVLIDQLKPENCDYLVAVHAEEAAGRNKLPEAFAAVVEAITKVPEEARIVQAVKAHRTGADGFDRLIKRVVFDGHVERGKRYAILDDVITQGGTLADLKGYIEARGGVVIQALTLTGKPNSAIMSITKPTLGLLRKAAGKPLEEWWHEQFGFDFSRLTESEARYLTKQINRDGIDAVRDRIIAAR